MEVVAALISSAEPFPELCRVPGRDVSLTGTVLGHQPPGAPGWGGRRLAVALGSVEAMAILPPLLLELLQPVHHVLVCGGLWWREAGSPEGYRPRGGGRVDQSKLKGGFPIRWINTDSPGGQSSPGLVEWGSLGGHLV